MHRNPIPFDHKKETNETKQTSPQPPRQAWVATNLIPPQQKAPLSGNKFKVGRKSNIQSQLILEKVEKELVADKWGVETMAVAIAAKKERRAQKGQAFNCFVLDQAEIYKDRASIDEIIKKNKEVTQFFENLLKQINEIPDGLHFQLAVRVGYYVTEDKNDPDNTHWFALDIMKLNGQLEIFAFDSVKYDDTDILLKELSKMPHVKVTQYIHDDVIGMVQTDSTNCSRFTLDNVFHLSLINIHPKLHQSIAIESLEPDKDNSNYWVIDAKNCPKELAPLLRNMQKANNISKLDISITNYVINLKGQTMLESAKQHTVNVYIDEDSPTGVRHIKPGEENKDESLKPALNKEGNPKQTNLVITHKKKQIAHKTSDFLQLQNPDLEKILNNRQGYAFIEYVTQHQKLSEDIQTKLDPIKSILFLIGKGIQSLKNKMQADPDNINLRADLKALEITLQKINNPQTHFKSAANILRNACELLSLQSQSFRKRADQLLERVQLYEENDPFLTALQSSIPKHSKAITSPMNSSNRIER